MNLDSNCSVGLRWWPEGGCQFSPINETTILEEAAKPDNYKNYFVVAGKVESGGQTQSYCEESSNDCYDRTRYLRRTWWSHYCHWKNVGSLRSLRRYFSGWCLSRYGCSFSCAVTSAGQIIQHWKISGRAHIILLTSSYLLTRNRLHFSVSMHKNCLSALCSMLCLLINYFCLFVFVNVIQAESFTMSWDNY